MITVKVYETTHTEAERAARKQIAEFLGRDDFDLTLDEAQPYWITNGNPVLWECEFTSRGNRGVTPPKIDS